jgi:tetratricopeptide (TPR) repeat protein
MAGIEAEPENPQSFFQAGQAYLGLKDAEGADSMFIKAAELYPRYEVEIEALREGFWVEEYNAAIDPLNAADLEAAVAGFERAHTVYQGRPEAMLNLGSLYSRLDQPEKSVDAYQQALDLMTGPKYAEVDSTTQVQWTENVELATYNLAQVLAQAGRNEEAVEAYSAYLEDHPDDITVLTNMAIVLQGAGMTDSASVIYDKLLGREDLGPRDYFVAGIGLFQAAEALQDSVQKVETYARSAVAFGMAAERMPTSRDAAYNLAQTLYLSDQYEALTPAAQRLVEIDAYNKNAYLLLAQARNRAGDPQEAVRVMERREALPFEVVDTELQPSAGGARLAGVVTNYSLEPGTPIAMTIYFIDRDGAEVGSTEVRVNAPPAEQSVQFLADFQSDALIIGYRYEVTSP